MLSPRLQRGAALALRGGGDRRLDRLQTHPRLSDEDEPNALEHLGAILGEARSETAARGTNLAIVVFPIPPGRPRAGKISGHMLDVARTLNLDLQLLISAHGGHSPVVIKATSASTLALWTLETPAEGEIPRRILLWNYSQQRKGGPDAVR